MQMEEMMDLVQAGAVQAIDLRPEAGGAARDRPELHPGTSLPACEAQLKSDLCTERAHVVPFWISAVA